MLNNIYIGLGSNLANPLEQIKRARRSIAEHPQIEEQGFSSLYRSEPMGPKDQPDYINAVMRVSCDLTALELLRVLQKIESLQGRVRKKERWGARTLDLDLLLYDDQQIDYPDLQVPHAGLAERAFVLYPLQEIAHDDLLIPGIGRLKQLIEGCAFKGLEKLRNDIDSK